MYYVVQRLSVPLVENSGPSAAWLKTCRARPLEAAVSLIEGVRSFADAGYFDAEHFLDGRKFALSKDGAVYLVDAPGPLATSPVRNVVDWALRGMWKDRNATKDGTCVADKDCPRLREQGRGDRVPGHKRAAREAGGWCRNGRCVGVDARAHVYDLATRAWALPLILAEGRFSSQKAKQRLEELIKRMRREAPEDRPSLFFSGVRSPCCCRVYEATTARGAYVRAHGGGDGRAYFGSPTREIPPGAIAAAPYAIAAAPHLDNHTGQERHRRLDRRLRGGLRSQRTRREPLEGLF